ncbi:MULTISPECIES: hypothetical protein [unclassified Pseudomonas]|uniref:hypothetical protein n=1 Tax=unclassified Pseudomonas TaxID=196821 RepID=UPI0002A39C86|nr:MULTISPECIES: hypothetical protein [unclassified Pseudomonas]MBB1607956.1 hypothetical protein [Pseudomonas sp. UMC76]MBB1637696.1 hypothetical protein [Pseudomonas sp. UME83]NTX91061.1 hypothetical protein [Pseudomonas sp. UMA643]NTY20880.1 hypothetical protein [Pseudomonas sp. UMC3103]NTY24807.1 hypothetical protein [Pseudomonas sp. UMA603]
MKRNLWRVFRWPLALAVLSLVGLVSALVGDGPWDALSWFALGVPLVVILAALARARRPSP